MPINAVDSSQTAILQQLALTNSSSNSADASNSFQNMLTSELLNKQFGEIENTNLSPYSMTDGPFSGLLENSSNALSTLLQSLLGSGSSSSSMMLQSLTAALHRSQETRNTQFVNSIGSDKFKDFSPEQITRLVSRVSEDGIGASVARSAITRLGDPYSKHVRGQGDYVDCSYLSRWSYQQAGVEDYKASSAAEQARYCIDNGYTIPKEELEVGDLVFWSFKENGRYKNVSHVGIYVGDNHVIDASSRRGEVVYREMFGQSSIVAYARPYKE